MPLRTRVTAIAVLIFAGLVYLFAWSPLLTVKSIETAGVPEAISSESIIKKSNIAVGEKLARIEPRSIERALQELSWMKKVSVSRNWINGRVTIEISSRVPVGLFKGRALDASGALFDYPGHLPNGLPTVSASTPALGLVAIDLFTHLPNDLRDSALSLSATGESSISSWHRIGVRDIKIAWGSSSQVDLKVSVFRALLALPENKNIRRVDLSAPHAPIVK